MLRKFMFKRRRLEGLLRGSNLSGWSMGRDVDEEEEEEEEEERVGVWEGGGDGVGIGWAAGVREGVENDVVGILRECGEVG